jgi:hypothetical protein
VTLYTRRQLLVLLLLLVAAGLGLAIGHWRRANPDLVEQVEQLDRSPAPRAPVSAPQLGDRPRAARSSPEAEPRRARRSRAPRKAPFTPNATTPAAPRPEDIDRNQATEVEPACWW